MEFTLDYNMNNEVANLDFVVFEDFLKRWVFFSEAINSIYDRVPNLWQNNICLALLVMHVWISAKNMYLHLCVYVEWKTYQDYWTRYNEMLYMPYTIIQKV